MLTVALKTDKEMYAEILKDWDGRIHIKDKEIYIIFSICLILSLE